MNDKIKSLINQCIYKKETRLNLSNTGLSEIPDLISSMDWLKVLDLSSNQIKIIENLPDNLTELYLHSNQIETIKKLSYKIKKLYLSSNQIKIIENLPNSLTELYLHSNQVETIKNLPDSLIKLDLRSNQIEKIENIPSNLKKLELCSNQIKNLSKNWKTILNSGLKIAWKEDYKIKNGEINLKGNELEVPPIEVVQEGHKAVLQYMEQYIEEQGKEEYLFESKLLILGESGAGKTTFAKKLRNPEASMPHKDATTHGIEVGKWKFPVGSGTVQELNHKDTDFHANLWDFGGQDVYHGTHKFFFSEKSLYVLLVDTREEKTDFGFWLNTIEQLTAEESSLIILLNRRAKRDYRIDENGLRGRFGSLLKEVYTVDLSKANEIPQLQDLIQNLLKNLPEIGVKLIESWVLIREDLTKETEKSITYKKFRAICKGRNVENPEFVKNISRYFNRIGIFTHYIDDPVLEDKIYLDSNWLTDAVYEILDNERAKNKKGNLTKTNLEKITKEKGLDFEINKLVALLNKFGLMYETPSSSYIVPRHLSSEKPYITWEYESDNTILHYKYTFDKYMPKGLMSQLIVALHKYIPNHDLVWNRGFNLSHKGANAEIIEQYGGTNQFDIRIIGEFRRDLLVIITEAFDEILSPFKKLEFNKAIKCPCHECKNSSSPYFHKINVLEKALIKKYKKPNPTVECQVSFDDVSVVELAAFIDVNSVVNQIRLNISPRERMSGEILEFLRKFESRVFLKFNAVDDSILNLSQQLESDMLMIKYHLETQHIDSTRVEMLVERIELGLEELPKEHQLRELLAQAKKTTTNPDIEAKGKFEVILPIIPGILQYKGELNVGFKAKLKKIWDNLKSGDFFTKEV